MDEERGDDEEIENEVERMNNEERGEIMGREMKEETKTEPRTRQNYLDVNKLEDKLNGSLEKVGELFQGSLWE